MELPSEYKGKIHIAVIGGTGIHSLPGFHQAHSLPQSSIVTPWGTPSSQIDILIHTHADGSELAVAFLNRHGTHHELAPHEVPNRANIAALRKLGVRCVIAFSAVGSLREEIRPRDFVIPDQIIDRTKGARPWTFFEDGVVVHVPFADPFDKEIGAVIATCGHALEGDGVRLHDGGLVVVMEGPAFSTRAESAFHRMLGGSVINMSASPEAKLAREAEMAYQMICMSTDYDCWHDSGDVSVELVMGHMKANAGNAQRLVATVLDELSKKEHAELVQGTKWKDHSKSGCSTHKEGLNAETAKKIQWLFPDFFN